MDENYKPGITFICSIRNSHQKMFCADKSDERGQGRNVPAGTVMSGYGGGMPESYHFHLSSHAGVGTVNPTFYNVLHDDNEIELDNMCNMTYALALDSKRCEKRLVYRNVYFSTQVGISRFLRTFKCFNCSEFKSVWQDV